MSSGAGYRGSLLGSGIVALLGILAGGLLNGCELVHRPLQTVSVEPHRPAPAGAGARIPAPAGKLPVPGSLPSAGAVSTARPTAAPSQPVPPTAALKPKPSPTVEPLPSETRPVAPLALTDQERQAEFSEKLQRLEGFLAGRRLDALLLKRPENFAWLSGGGSNRSVTGPEGSRGTLLLRRDGKRYLLAPNEDVFRWADEELAGLGFLPKPFKWYKTYLGPEERTLLQALTAQQTVGADVAYPGTAWVGPEINTLRRTLTAGEIRKYRWLGQQTAAAAAAAAKGLCRGDTEEAAAARLKRELWAAQVEPMAVQVTADERRVKYGIAPPRQVPMQQAAFLNVVAQRWGLWISLTRTVSFGPPEAAARRQQEALTHIAARLQATMRPGRTLDQILQVGIQAYQQAGYGKEWEQHEQGGIIGYRLREAVAFPGSPVPLRENQAVVWRVRLPRTCVEETFLVTSEGLEVLTAAADWPSRSVTVAGRSYQVADILERSDEKRED